MGMLFKSQAVLYLGARLSDEFAATASPPAQGLKFWQGASDEAVEFRDALDASMQKKAPALGSITLEFLDMTIPDSADGDSPGSSDPSTGKSYKRWIIFWKRLRKNDSANYKKLVKGVLDILLNPASPIKSITFEGMEDSTIKVTVKDTGPNRKITLFTPKWHELPALKAGSKK
jgi:hypothetical protein